MVYIMIRAFYNGCKRHGDCFSCPFTDCIASEKDLRKRPNERQREKHNATDKARQAYNAYQAAWRHAHPERRKEIAHNSYIKRKNKSEEN